MHKRSSGMAGTGIGINSKIYPESAVANVFSGGALSKGIPYHYDGDERLMWPKTSSDVAGMRRPTRGRLDDDDYIEKSRNDYITFIRQNFHQMECERFVPRKNQNVKERRKLRCECGAVLSDHVVHAEGGMTEEKLLPDELKEVMAQEYRLEPPPADIPKVHWDKKNHFHKSATNAFGRINYINIEYTGGRKPTKYIRLWSEDSVDKVITLMTDYWKIMEPREPHLCISVVGGAKNFKLDGRNRETFRTGLIKAAKTTDAWLITSGFNMGVMKEVGEAVSEGQSFTWEKDRMTHCLRCIAIAPWGFVRERHRLESQDGRGKFDADYKTSNSIPHGQPVPLNPDHTHFIFVDDGFRNNYRGVADFRARFQSKIARSKSAKEDKGLGIPVVLVVVEGGEDTIRDANKCLEHDIPVVVCGGTGRAANILAYAYEHVARSGDETMIEKYKIKLGDKIRNTYGQKWSDAEVKDKTKEILDVVLKCCEKKDAIVIHNMNKHEELDVAILSALLKVKGKGGDQTEIEQRKNKLRLAMTWNRADIAQEEIFREDVLWPQGRLDDMLVDAIILDKVEFVQLICKQGITMKEFLTKARLQELYIRAMETKTLRTNHVKMLTDRLKITDFDTDPDLSKVTQLMTRLMDKYDDNYQYDKKFYVDSDKITYKYPYKQLLIWAVLLDRQNMAKYFWEMGTEPICSAIAASRINHRMLKLSGLRKESSLKETFVENKKEFEQLALSVLNACHIKDRSKAIELAETKSPSWSDMTSMEMAALAKDQAFLASEACQNSISSRWHRGIMATWPKKVIGVILPFLVCTRFIEVDSTDMLYYDRYKIQQFFKAPSTKFLNEFIMYGVFMVLFTYMVLVDFKLNQITPIELLTVGWVCTFVVDDTYTAFSIPAPTLHRKRRNWYTILKVVDLVNFMSTVIAFILHTRQYNEAAKTIYCINCVSFCLRILKTYTAHSKLGPKLVMIKNMIVELGLFIMILCVFLFAYGISSQGLLYLQRQPDWKILKDILYYPYWQLYGEIYLDELETDNACVSRYNTSSTTDTENITYCRQYHYLVEIFLAGYLIIGNILLLNLLIAIFSNVFKSIDDNSIEIWKYQMYFFTMEYNSKTTFVPPFSIIEHIYLLCVWICEKVCCKKKKKDKQFSSRHLEYLQLFEKEEMSTYLRKKKEEDKSSEEKISKLQKRVDEQFHQLEEEFFAEAEDSRIFQNEIKEEMQNLKETVKESLSTTRDTLGLPPMVTLPVTQTLSVSQEIPSNYRKWQDKEPTMKHEFTQTSSTDTPSVVDKEIQQDKAGSSSVSKNAKQQKKLEDKSQKVKDAWDAHKPNEQKPQVEIKDFETLTTKDKFFSEMLGKYEQRLANIEKRTEKVPQNLYVTTDSEVEPKPVTIDTRPVIPKELYLTREMLDPVLSVSVKLQQKLAEARRKQIEADNTTDKNGIRVYHPPPQRQIQQNDKSNELSDSSDSSDDVTVRHRRRRRFRNRSRDSFSDDAGYRRGRGSKKALYRENTADYFYRENTSDHFY